MKNFCRMMSAFIAFLLYIRIFTGFFDKGSAKYTILQAFIALLATVMPVLEKMTESRIQSAEVYLWTK